MTYAFVEAGAEEGSPVRYSFWRMQMLKVARQDTMAGKQDIGCERRQLLAAGKRQERRKSGKRTRRNRKDACDDTKKKKKGKRTEEQTLTGPPERCTIANDTSIL